VAGSVAWRGQDLHRPVAEDIEVAIELDHRIGAQPFVARRYEAELAGFGAERRVVFGLLDVQRRRAESMSGGASISHRERGPRIGIHRSIERTQQRQECAVGGVAMQEIGVEFGRNMILQQRLQARAGGVELGSRIGQVRGEQHPREHEIALDRAAATGMHRLGTGAVAEAMLLAGLGLPHRAQGRIVSAAAHGAPT
jgi:hypothetical protein